MWETCDQVADEKVGSARRALPISILLISGQNWHFDSKCVARIEF